MRLEFNYIVIDDDFNDEDDSAGVEELINKVNNKLVDKGFEPKALKFSSKVDFDKYLEETKEITSKRIDLYLSDNNLGGCVKNERSSNLEHEQDGIEIYFELKNKFICDFVLYTRSDSNEIVSRMSENLLKTKDPSLFSRFSFIARDGNNEWHSNVLEFIDFIITKREEMNNLRGLFAEKISRIDLHLKKIFNRSEDEKLFNTIKNIPDEKFTDDFKRKYLHSLRQIRNALLHKDEEFDNIRKEYKIVYQEEDSSGRITSRQKIIYESEFHRYRKCLLEAYKKVMSWE